MKRYICIILSLSLILITMQFSPVTKVFAADTTSYFVDNGAVLHGNPYMGIRFDVDPSMNFADQGITDLIAGRTLPTGADVININLAWVDLEPTHNSWQWTRLDAAISAAGAQGKKVELSLDMSEGSAYGNYFLPDWIFTQQGVPYRTIDEWGIMVKQPLYYNSTYLSLLNNAITVIGNRYNGNPNIAWVNLRVIARFGEWGGWSDADNFVWPNDTVRDNTLHAIIDDYKAAFSSTMVLFENPASGVLPGETVEQRKVRWAYDYAMDTNANQEFWGLRSDTIPGISGGWRWQRYDLTEQYGGFGSWINRIYSRDFIMVGEGAGSYNSPQAAGDTHLYVDNALYDMRCNSIAFNNAGYDQWSDMLSIWGDEFTRAAKYEGYRFLLNKVLYNNKVSSNGTFTLSQTWTNNGYGHCPKKYALKAYLTDPLTGDIKWSGVDNNFDQRKWFKGEYYDVNSSFTLNSVPNGVYNVGIAMVDSNGNPVISMPMDNGYNKIYMIGQISVATTGDSFTPPTPLCSVRYECVNATNQSNMLSYYDREVCDGIEKDEIDLDSSGSFGEYNNVNLPYAGDYVLDLKASTLQGVQFRIEVDGYDRTGTITAISTGGWEVFKNYTRKINNLSAGRHTIKIVKLDDGWALFKYFKLTKDDSNVVNVESENYSSQNGLWTSGITDLGTATGVGCCDTNDWMQYDSINIPVTGKYLTQFRVSTNNINTQSFKLLVDGVDKTGTIVPPNTGGLNNFVTLDKMIDITAGTHTFKLVMVYGNSQIFFNWMKFSLNKADILQNENYSSQSGLSISSINDFDGTTGIGSCNTNDWAQYDSISVPVTGRYLAQFRVSTNNVGTQSFKLLIDGVDKTGTIVAPNTGGLDNFVTLDTMIDITAGAHSLKLVIVNGNSMLFINWMKITPNNADTILLQNENYADEVGLQVNWLLDSTYQLCINYLHTNDYASYDGIYVQSDAIYTPQLRLFTGLGTEKIRIELDGIDVTGTFTLPNTGNVFTTVTLPNIKILKGVHRITIKFVEGYGSCAINWMSFTPLA